MKEPRSRRAASPLLPVLVLALLLPWPAFAAVMASPLTLSDSWTSDLRSTESLSTLQGRYVVLSMFYTGCRRICPQTVRVMQRAQQALRSRGIEPELVLVSYAAEQENAASLADFRTRNQLDAHWHLLAGSGEQTRDFATRLGLQNYSGMDDHIFHDFAVMLIEPDGQPHSLDWHHRDIEALVSGVLARRQSAE